MSTCTRCFGTKRFSGQVCLHCEGTGEISELQAFNDSLCDLATFMSFNKVQEMIFESIAYWDERAREYGISLNDFRKSKAYNEFDSMLHKIRSLPPMMQFILIEWHNYDAKELVL